MRTGTLAWPSLALAFAPALQAQETVLLEAAWGPIVSSTYHLREEHAPLAEILDAGPRTPRAAHDVEALRALLPPANADVLWDVDPHRGEIEVGRNASGGHAGRVPPAAGPDSKEPCCSPPSCSSPFRPPSSLARRTSSSRAR